MLRRCSSASQSRNRAPAVVVFDIRQRRAMKLPRRAFLQLAAVAAVPRFAWAQAYPIRPVRTIVGLAAGGAADILARLIAQWLSERLGQQIGRASCRERV